MPRGARRNQSIKTATCSLCGHTTDARGMFNHKKKCVNKQATLAQYADLRKRAAEEQLQRTPKRSRKQRRHTRSPSQPVAQPQSELQPQEDPFARNSSPRVSPGVPDIPEPSVMADIQDGVEETEDIVESSGSPSRPSTPMGMAPPSRSVGPDIRGSEVDDIRVEFHPATGRATQVYPFEEFVDEQEDVDLSGLDTKPWRPFKSRADFEFAALAHEAGLSNQQVDRLLALIQDVNSGQSQLSFKNHRDVDAGWAQASVFHPTFTKSVVSTMYHGHKYDLEFHHRPLWDWIIQQVQDPKLAPYMHWDARQMSKFDGKEWERFYEEPWTADKFWEVQSNIASAGPDAKPLAIVLWSDKTKLSSFGSQKGHPIIARIGNIDASLRNGTGLGSGRVVGFIPVIEDDTAQKSKTQYIDYKHAVFHDSFRILLQDVVKHSKLGYKVMCGDKQLRSLYPYIHIIAADYEEQTFLALVRGLGGLCPCTICLIPKGSLSNLSVSHPRRTDNDTQALFEAAKNLQTKQAQEDLFKPQGLRPVENAFWAVANTDIHQALSFDRLHAYHLGLWGKYMWVDLKAVLSAIGRRAETHVDRLIAAVPPWPKLTHFQNALQIEFNDGSKWADLSRIIIPCCVNAISAQQLKGYALLKMIRKYLECDMYMSLRVHTTHTLEDLEQSIQDFGKALQEYKRKCVNDEDQRNWDGIVKAHTHIHAADDIRQKGVMVNMDTKPSERMNGFLRDVYLNRTNFRNIEGQLATHEDRSMVSAAIQANIEARDDYIALQAQVTAEEAKESKRKFNHITLGSQQPSVSISELTLSNIQDAAFNDFLKKLITCMRNVLHQQYIAGELTEYNEPPTQLLINASEKVMEFRLVKVDYESKMTWRRVTDLLRCSPMFQGAPRHDSVMVNMGAGKNPIFCKLVHVFTYTMPAVSAEKQHTYALALVQPLDAPTGPSRVVDRDLALCRVRARPRKESIIIPARSILRGALLIEDSNRIGDYFVLDTLDGDMFLRAIELFPRRKMAAQKHVGY